MESNITNLNAFDAVAASNNFTTVVECHLWLYKQKGDATQRKCQRASRTIPVVSKFIWLPPINKCVV